jgi:hypothetical protein
MSKKIKQWLWLLFFIFCVISITYCVNFISGKEIEIKFYLGSFLIIAVGTSVAFFARQAQIKMEKEILGGKDDTSNLNTKSAVPNDKIKIPEYLRKSYKHSYEENIRPKKHYCWRIPFNKKQTPRKNLWDKICDKLSHLTGF